MKKKIIDGSGKVLFDPADYNVLRITDDELQKTYIDKGISGTKYDAARQILGGDWRIPTSAEMDELINNCTFTRDNDNKTTTITGPNGNSIILNRSDATYKFINASQLTTKKEGYHVVKGMYISEYRDITVQNNIRITVIAWYIPVSNTKGVDLGLSVRWANGFLGSNGITDLGQPFHWGEIVPYNKTLVTTQEQCGTSADPLMGYYEELEETDHYLNTRGLNIVRKQINDKIDEVEKGMPQPTPIADADETVHHVLGQEVQDNQVVVQPRSINELSDGSRVADLEEWQRSLGIFSIQRGTEEGSWIINVLDAE